MKIVIIGGSGLIGAKLVRTLREQGHETISAAPDTGVNTLSGEGLASVIDGADVVVDVSNSPSFEGAAALNFFTTSTRNILDAEQAAGVRHHVALSVVGTERLAESGYFRAKMAQEKLIEDAPIPYSIVHATQFFEFCKSVAASATDGNTVRLAPALVQPMAADDVATAVARIAVGRPVNGIVEVAGPEAIHLDELVHRYLEDRGDPRRVIANPRARYFGAVLGESTLMPSSNAMRSETRFEDWLASSHGAGASSAFTDERSKIRPFRYDASDAELLDLRRRIEATRWPERETVADDSQGVRLDVMRSLAQYWANDYDWRAFEKRLNALPQFVTEIDDVDIHFIHVRSKHEHALPLIVAHGWPGSFIWFLKIIEPLTNPTAHGAGAADAFDVVIPSMPGYGFSGKPTTPGWDAPHIARAWVELMRRLGYTRFVAQGGDWGALIVDQMGVLAPPELLGIHTNMPCAVPADIDSAAFAGAPAPSHLAGDERNAYDRLADFYAHSLSYAREMGNRPQTLYELADSPIGLASWLLDLEPRSLALNARVFSGVKEGLTRDDILDNATLYWLTNTGVSAGRLYWENKLPFFPPKGVRIPVAVSVFPDEIYVAPRSWVEKAYPNLLHYNALPEGGHFPAWEQPQYFSDEMRAGFRSLRK